MHYFALLRPMLFFPVWIFFFLGVHFAKGGISLRSISIFVLYTLLMGGVYILNQIVDIESDRKNEKLFLLPDEIIPVSHAWIEMVLLFVVSLMGSFLIGKTVFYLFLVSLFSGITYSMPPVEIKGRPFLDIVWNAGGYGIIAFSVGWVSGGMFSASVILRSLPYFLAVAGVFVNTTILDIKGDRDEGKITTGVFLGKRKTLLLAVLLNVLAIAVCILLEDYICLVAAGASFPLFLYALIDQGKKSILLTVRVPVVILVIIVFIISPISIPLFLAVFFLLRFYYRRNFDIDYPAVFSGKDRKF